MKGQSWINAVIIGFGLVNQILTTILLILITFNSAIYWAFGNLSLLGFELIRSKLFRLWLHDINVYA